MADIITINVPDIGGATDVDVIEILVKPGDEIEKDSSLITLESDKASMDIPSPEAGKVIEVKIKVGDKVSEGDIILTLTSDASVKAAPNPQRQLPIQEAASQSNEVKPEQFSEPVTTTEELEVFIPDIGGATQVDVIEILVSINQAIEKDQSLITLEGDKATMDIPAPAAGTIKKICMKVGDKVSQGSLILILEAPRSSPAALSQKSASVNVPSEEVKSSPKNDTETLPSTREQPQKNDSVISAGPAVRRLARELGVNLAEVAGSGRKARISKEDLQQFVKRQLNEKKSSGAFSLPQAATIDFSKFGEINIKPLNKIKRLTAVNVHRSWITIPHVTQFDEADITELEVFRKSETNAAKQANYKLTLLAFVTKVVGKALIEYPQFNASLDASGENLIYKNYYNIGIAVETPNGLVVPVIKNVNQLTISELAIEMARLSSKAREKGLMPNEMNGGCFTISSLGGIGGRSFTPIVNSPEVAILGLSRSTIKPVYQAQEFIPRLMLPLSLSYDHRVIDGAEAARFTGYLVDCLADIRRILL